MTLTVPMTDRVGCQLLSNGDLHGFAALYGHHHRQVEAATRTLAGPHLVDLLAAEAFARLLLMVLEGGRPDRPLRYVLLAALRESCREHRTLSGGDAAPNFPPLPHDWRERLRRAAEEHLVVAGHATPCRSADLVRRLASTPDVVSAGRHGGHHRETARSVGNG